MSAFLYLEHLRDSDLALLASVEGEGAEALRSRLHAEPGHLERVLRHPALFELLFGAGDDETLLRVSPFLVFAVLIQRSAQELQEAQFVQEWIGPGRRVPMFEVGRLRDFSSSPVRRLFLAEVLSSYTRVASGTVWVQTGRGWRRRRFSELDPLRLIEMLETVPSAERPGIYRRLGDLALFLTGVFPDHAGASLLPALKRRRLERALGWTNAPDEPVGSGADIALLERLGQRSYHMAWRATDTFGTGTPGILSDMSEGFADARRVLNFVTDRYMFPLRGRWFPMGDT